MRPTSLIVDALSVEWALFQVSSAMVMRMRSQTILPHVHVPPLGSENLQSTVLARATLLHIFHSLSLACVVRQITYSLTANVCAMDAWPFDSFRMHIAASEQRRCVTSAREEPKRTVVAAGIVFLSFRFICMRSSHSQHSTHAVSPCRNRILCYTIAIELRAGTVWTRCVDDFSASVHQWKCSRSRRSLPVFYHRFDNE